ncbi:MAG: ribonuclease P protein component [Rhodospirillales bacterium]|nr:ribonuclease P protein component [Rhodospirillales bacterium]
MTEPIKPLRPGRIKVRRDFLRVAKSGTKWVTPGLVMQVGIGPDTQNDGDMRVGFTVSKKVGNAVERNRVRRRLRAIADKILPATGKPGRDYVVIGRKAALKRSFADLTQDLLTAVAKADPDRRKQGHR